MDNIIENLANKCRACLEEDSEMNSLFSEFHEHLTLANILETNTSIKVTKNDGLSEFLCMACTTILVNFHTFRIELLKNDVKIKAKKEELLAEETPADYVVNSSSESVLKNLKEIKSEIIIKTETDLEQVVEDDGAYNEKHTETNQVDCDKLPKKSCVTHIVTEGKSSNICKHCLEAFSTPEALKQHIKIHKTYICDKCGSSFLKRRYLVEHNESHEPIGRFACPYCGKNFRRRHGLAIHKRLHTNPGEFVCDQCGKVFNLKTTLKTHVKLIHNKERNYLCVICNLKFPLKSTLDKHVKRHDVKRNKEFKCEKCDSCYKDKSSLHRHVQVNHTDDNIGKYKCIACDRDYRTKTNLLKHKRRGCKRAIRDTVKGNVCEDTDT